MHVAHDMSHFVQKFKFIFKELVLLKIEVGTLAFLKYPLGQAVTQVLSIGLKL